jgi:hypothetical protein
VFPVSNTAGLAVYLGHRRSYLELLRTGVEGWGEGGGRVVCFFFLACDLGDPR